MQSAGSGQGEEHAVVFEIVRRVPYGRAVFLCGSLEELGQWSPSRALRLTWQQGDKWQCRLVLAAARLVQVHSFEFKFLVGDWADGGAAEWLQYLLYLWRYADAEWNMQNYIFFLKTQDYQQQQTYYMTGEIQALGGWREKRVMRRLGCERTNPFLSYWKNNPEFAEESSFCRMFMSSFSVRRDLQSFNYYYVCFGSTIESQNYPGRCYRMLSEELPKDRIIEFDWEGSKVIIDQSTLDRMILQRFTNQIYLAARLHTPQHFQRLFDTKFTFLYNIHVATEDSPALRTLLRPNSVPTRTTALENPDSPIFAEQLKDVVDAVDQLVVSGHRVCLHVTNRVLRLLPVHLLYLILFLGYSFGEAVQAAGKAESQEGQCRTTREIYNLINTKLMRGRAEIKQ